MNAATATAAQAPSAQAPAATSKKEPAWLQYASLADLDAYIKSAKIAKVRADDMRTRWNLAHPAPGTLPAMFDPSTSNEVLQPMKEVKKGQGTLSALQKKQDVPLQPVAAPAKASSGLVAAIGERMKVINAPAAPGLVTRYIDPRKIDVREGWNARIDFGDLAELKESIRSQKRLDGHGLVNDVRVKEKADGRYELIDGERRLISVMGLIDDGEEFAFGIPAKVEPAESTDSALIIKMFVANRGKPFLPYEEAMYYKRLQDSGMTIAQIEKETGRSDNSIVGALALLQADDDLVDAIVKGEVGATLGKSIAVNVRGNKERQRELTVKARAASAAAKKGDNKPMRAVKAEVDKERRAKAARTSKKLAAKMASRPQRLSDSDAADLGAAVAARLKDLMEKIGMPFDADMREWIGNDRELQIAAQYGALVALKRVMGVTEKVEF